MLSGLRQGGLTRPGGRDRLAAMDPKNRYCICCGDEVPSNTLQREGKVELTCVYCGFVLDVTLEVGPAAPAAACILTADDAEMTRELLSGMLVKNRLAREVVSVENGQEFITALTKRLAGNLPVDLAILDLQMPVMDGITAARVMRAVEEKYRVEKTPILFFSARKCDETLKQQLSLFAPASYINKGTEADPLKLVERIDQLITYLLNRYAAPSS